jgi:hypothetical protein
MQSCGLGQMFLQPFLSIGFPLLLSLLNLRKRALTHKGFENND